MTFKTDWLPTDTFDVKVDFVRIFGNAQQLITVPQAINYTYHQQKSRTWKKLYHWLWGRVPETANVKLKTDWNYSDVIKEEYFLLLISRLNNLAINCGLTEKIISLPIKLNSNLLNQIESLEEAIYYAIY